MSSARSAGTISLLDALPRAAFSTNLADALSAVSRADTRFVVDGGNWTVASGIAREGTPVVDAGTWFDLATRNADQRDGTVNVSVHLLPGSGSPGTAGVMVRMSEDGSGAAVSITEASGLAILTLRAGRPLVVAAQPAAIPEGRWIALAVTVSGKRLRATVDGASAIEAEIPDLPTTGRVGVFRQQGDGAQFRSMSITSDKGTEPLPFDFAPAPAMLAPLTGLPAAIAGDSPGAPHNTLVRAVTLADDTRTSLMLLPDTEIRLPVDAPSGAYFQSEVAVVAPSGEPQAGASRLSVTLEAGGRTRLLESRQFAADGFARSWEPSRAVLGDSALQGTLIFRNTTVGEAGGATLAIATPMLMVSRRPTGRPNVVFITIDTLRADRIGTYGYRRPTSPFLDELARGGVVFEDVVAQSSWTKASMASMFTSTYPETNGVRGVMDKLPSGLATLAEASRRHGYFAAGVQSNPWMHSRFNMAGGFDEYKIAPGQASGARVSELALDVLRRRGAAPFFLYVHFMDVHNPYTPAGAPRFGTAPSDLYDAEIRQLDAQLRALHAAIAEFSPAESTLFVVTSDHGEEFGEHGGMFHGSTVHREQIQVPWIVSWRGAIKPARVAAEVANIDVAPTVLELIGVPRPGTFEGQSRVSAMRATGTVAPEGSGGVIFAQTGLNDAAPDRDWLAVLSGRWKYIRDRRTGTYALYDRARDVGEQHDAAAAHPDVVQLFARRSDAFAARKGVSHAAGVTLDSELRDRLRALGYLK